MKIIKRIVVAALLGIGVVVLAVVAAWLLVDDATLVSALSRQLQAASDTHISYQGDARVTRTLTPTLSVEQLLVEDSNADYQVETSSFRVQLSLLKLLLRQLDIPLLRLGDTRITVKQGASDEESGKISSQAITNLRFKPVLHDVQIGKISLVRDGEELHLPEIDVDEIEVKLEPDSDTLALTAQIELAGETFAIDATLPDIHNAVKKQMLGFSVSAKSTSYQLDADGQLPLDKTSSTVDARIRASAHDLSKLPTGIDELVIPGTLTANAQLAGSIDQLALSNISANWEGPGESDLKVNGGIDNVAELDGIQLQLDGKLDKPDWLKPLLPDSMATLNSADLSAGISGAYKQLGIRAFKLQAKTGDELDLLLYGKFDVASQSAGMQPENIDLALTFSAPTTHAARGLLFEQVPELGAINGKTNVHAVTGAPALKDILIKAKDNAGIEVDLSGSIASFPLDPDQPNTGYDLDVAMKATKASVLAKRLGVDLPLTGPAKLAYRIEGDTQALALKKINLTAGTKKAVQISAQGQLLFSNWDLDDPLQSVDLKLQANSRNTASFNKLAGQQIPELGALSATARLHTVSGKHRMNNLRIQNHAGAPVNVRLAGSVNDVIFFPKSAVKGIRLNAKATASDSAQLNALFGLKNTIPAIGPFDASAVISGSQQQLHIKDVAVSTGQPEIVLVNANGSLGWVSAASKWHPRKADLQINARSSSSSAFVKSLGYDIPELGPVTARARMQDKGKKLGIESGFIQVGDAGAPVVQATGFVDDLFGTAKTRWNVKLNMDGHTLATFAGQQKIPDLGPLVGSMVIANSDGSLGIDALDIKSSKPDILSLAVNGRFDDFQEPNTLSLDANLTARDLQLIGALFDQEWPAIGPVAMKSGIKQADKGTQFDTELSAGDMRLDAALTGVYKSSPPHYISGKITAQEFFLPELIKEPEDSEEKKKPAKSQVFSRTPIDFGWLKKTDLDLAVDIASFSKEKSQLDSAQFVITQKAGHLSISPATLVYPKGKLDLDVQIDAQDPPRVSFKADGKNLDPWHTLDMQQDRKDFDTDVAVDVTVTTSGASLHEMAGNTDGKIYITMKDGKIRRALLDLVLVDVVGWTFSKATREKFTDIDCGVADYDIKQGVLTTKAFLLDSKHIAISGDGSIDLGQELLDIVLLPKKKSRVIGRADPVKITGPLSDPSVKVIPLKSAVTTYGGLIFGPYIFAGVTVVDYLSKAVGIGKKKISPCQEYEDMYKSSSETTQQ